MLSYLLILRQMSLWDPRDCWHSAACQALDPDRHIKRRSGDAAAKFRNRRLRRPKRSGKSRLRDALLVKVSRKMIHNASNARQAYACQASTFPRGIGVSPLAVNNSGMQNLKLLRIQRGLTQEQLAEKADVNQATISKIEKGTANFTLDMIQKIAAALDVSPAELFELRDLQRRALEAINAIDPAKRDAALVVLEAMAQPRQS